VALVVEGVGELVGDDAAQQRLGQLGADDDPPVDRVVEAEQRPGAFRLEAGQLEVVSHQSQCFEEPGEEA
jgi:hypothetical protein